MNGFQRLPVDSFANNGQLKVLFVSFFLFFDAESDLYQKHPTMPAH
jgi:hypothetical protein